MERLTRVAMGVGIVALLAAGCGGSSSGQNSAGNSKALVAGKGLDIRPAPKGGGDDPDVGLTPVWGGKITYALEAEDSNGYCLPESQLDISGEQVARTLYDTLTVPGKDGKYHPYLAKSVTHSADNKTWTIGLRSGIQFSDGSPLTAQVVKNNIDAYRGAYPARKPLLFIFVFQNIASVTVVDPLTVQVTTKVPWVDFDAHLFSQGRMGIIGQSQLDDPKSCATKPVGTGPFMLKSWHVDERYVMVRNPHYWQHAANGRALPYLDEIDYVPIIDGNGRVRALESGQVQALIHSDSPQIATLRDDAANGKVRMITSTRYGELGYLLLNVTKAPFDDPKMRLAAQEAVDYTTINNVIGKNVSPNMQGPFSPDSMGYVAKTGLPATNVADAKRLVAAWVSQHHGAKPAVSIISTPDTTIVKTVEMVQGYLKDAGFNVNFQVLDQSQLINQAVSGNFQVTVFRNHGGIDPDEQYVWWHGGSPVNFGHFSDPVIDCLLDTGRSLQDATGCLQNAALNKQYPGLSALSPTDRPALYKAVNKEFAKQLWDIWGAISPWTVATSPKVHGIFGPKLPDGATPWEALLNGNPTLGMWVAK